MSNTVGGKIVWELDVVADKLTSGLHEASKQVETVSKNISGTIKDMGRGMQDMGRDMSIAITAPLTALGASAFKFTEIAGRYSSVEDAFKSMTKGMGIDAKQFQKDVADATGGQIDNLTILQGATRGLALIGKDAFNDFGKDFTKMAEMSKKAARATGQDVDFMFNSLVLGISRESKLILDNLGVSIDLTRAKEEYAKSLGKTTEELTQSEAKHAVLNATMQQLEATYGSVAVSAGGFSGAWQQLTTEITNSQIAIGKELEPELAKLTKDLTALAKEILPEVISILRSAILWWTSLDDTTQKNIISFIAIVTALGPVLLIIGAFTSAVGGIISATLGAITIIGKFSFILQALGVTFGIIKAGAIVLGTFLAGVSAPVWIAIAAITALIAIGVALWRNWDFVSAKARELSSVLIQNVRMIWEAFQSLPGRISNALSGLYNAITRPFRDAWGYIERITREIREALDRINPFHRESPSLVDNVKSGINEIKKSYGSLTSMTFPKLSNELSMNYNMADVETGTNQNVVVNVGKVESMQDIDMISREIGYRFSLI